jgi:hypothetical protein
MEQSQPDAAHAERIDPIVLPDVAGQPHPSSADADGTGTGEHALRNVLPAIHDVAQRVGGYKKLAEIAAMLDQAGK